MFICFCEGYENNIGLLQHCDLSEIDIGFLKIYNDNVKFCACEYLHGGPQNWIIREKSNQKWLLFCCPEINWKGG